MEIHRIIRIVYTTRKDRFENKIIYNNNLNIRKMLAKHICIP